MKFDMDRLSQLAGISTEAADNTEKVSANRAVRPTSDGLIRESRNRIRESSDLTKLREIIRKETHSIIKTLRENSVKRDERLVERSQRSKSLTEAMTTMSFAGPGFGGKSLVLGAPMTSAKKLASLFETEVSGNCKKCNEAEDCDEADCNEEDLVEADEFPDERQLPGDDDDRDLDAPPAVYGGTAHLRRGSNAPAPVGPRRDGRRPT